MSGNRKFHDLFNPILLLLVIYLMLLESNGFERKLSYTLNPGCSEEQCGPNSTHSVTVVHVSAVGSNDTLHYVWDFEGKPSVLMALTSNEAKLIVDWDAFLFNTGEQTIRFSEEPKYTFGIVINKIVEFNDMNDSGFLDMNNTDYNYTRYLYTEFFDWKRSSLRQDSHGVILNIEANNFQCNATCHRNGTVRISLKAYGSSQHGDTLPHLLHSANSSLVELEVDRLETEPSFRNSRFAVELLLASSDSAGQPMSIKERESLDDEQSPGVFKLVDLLTPSSQSSPDGGGFLQWRPVAYIARSRSLANSTDTNSYAVTSVANPGAALNNTLLFSYYGYDLVNTTLVQGTVVSFGGKQDGFYKKTNYITWAFSFGFGKPPNEDFSLLIILVMCVGLGLPALLIVVSGIVLLVRRITRKKDELCLSR